MSISDLKKNPTVPFFDFGTAPFFRDPLTPFRNFFIGKAVPICKVVPTL